MASLSEILRSNGEDVLVHLFAGSNDHELVKGHVNLTFLGNGNFVNVIGTARVLGTDNQPGRYKGSFNVTYLRERFENLIGPTVVFTYPTLVPFTFQELADHLSSAFALVLEPQDVLAPTVDQVISPTTVINELDLVDGVLKLRVAPNSPRFIPFVVDGSTIDILIVDPNGGQLDLLAATTLLSPIASMDA